jgi:phosphonopyruvate decarboxylase
MTRTAYVKNIMGKVDKDDIVIASTGFISREVFKYDRPLNFYMMGSMGNALAIGIGLAMNVKQKVIVIEGDGAALMGLSSMVTAEKYDLGNLEHIILDNECHESTGGQPTSSYCIDFVSIRPSTKVFYCEVSPYVPPRITLSPKQITARFKNAIAALGNK